MSDTKRNSFLTNRLNAFAHAFAGLVAALKHETHLKIHLLAAVMVIFTGWYYSISRPEWLAVGLCIGMVISLELINSAIERLCNKLVSEQNTEVKYIKDVAAAAVLVAAIVAMLVAVIIFWPYLVN